MSGLWPMKLIPRLVCLSTSLLYLLLSATAQAQDNTAEWMAKMSKSSLEHSFEGVFVYQADGITQTMRITHRARPDGGVRERLVTLSGPQHELIRERDKVLCISADNKSVIVERKHGRHSMLNRLPDNIGELERYYNIQDNGVRRVAERKTRMLSILPLDALRYGHHYWVDEQSGLLLRSKMLDVEGEVLEEFFFTNMRLRKEIADKELASHFDTKGFSTREKGWQQVSEKRTHSYELDKLPQGFRLTVIRYNQNVEDESILEQLVFTDGLASVSAFIEPAHKGDKRSLGSSHSGAVHAHALLAGDNMVTAVGEVPAVTVEQIAQSLKQHLVKGHD